MDGANPAGLQRGSWVVACSLLSVHVIAFAMLYLVVVQMNWAFRDYFNVVGTNPTPRFQSASMVSDFIARFTPLVLLVLAFHLFVVFRLARRGNRWTSAYSHLALICMGATGFLWTAWGVHAMTWGQPGIANPEAVATVEQETDQLAVANMSLDE